MSVTIIGSGLAGLSAAYTLAKQHISSNLISVYPSERAQSVLAEGGINAALDTMGQDDTTELHFEETMKAGVYLADPNAVDALTAEAPETVRRLAALGVPFHQKNGKLILRSFGGQKKKRTAYAKSSTGKMLMSALIDAVRRYEAEGLITRYPHHELERLVLEETTPKRCQGVIVRDTYTGEGLRFGAPVILCMGGLNGMFPGRTTGTTANSCEETGVLFMQGLAFGNLEMIQYHPTTLKISSKLCLVSEAARGEGGRLFALRDGKRWYFMEEKYPELGNLMPRDVVSREEYFVIHDPDQPSPVYLDMTGLSEEIWKTRLPDLRKEIMEYKKKDPKKEPIQVDPGIHYFMGGIDVDAYHRTNIVDLYAAGECCDQYHGANRLGGNSLLGAIHGGKTAARTVMTRLGGREDTERHLDKIVSPSKETGREGASPKTSQTLIEAVAQILSDSLGIVRREASMQEGLRALDDLLRQADWNERERGRIFLAKAMISSALFRKESRGAHYRSDYPSPDEDYRKTQVACYAKGKVCITQREIPERRSK